MTDERDDDALADDKSSGAYALGALSAAEAAAFERRLAGNEDLRSEVAGFTDTAALLGAAVPPMAPPARIRNDLLAAIASTPQLPAEGGAVDTDEPRVVVAPVTPIGSAAGTGSKRASRGARSSRPRLTYFVAAAAAVAAVFIGGTVVGANLNGGPADTQASAFQELAVLSTSPDMARTVIELPAGGTAALMTSDQHGLSAVVLEGAAALPSDEVYQAWLIRDGKPTSAGVVPTGANSIRVLEGAFHDGDTVALTVEPKGGSDSPTSAPIEFTA